MFKKDYRELSAIKHVVAWWIGTPVMLLLIFALPASFYESEHPGSTLTAALWAVMVGVMVGPFLGLVAWLMNRGLHNIASGLRALREASRQAQYEARVEAAAEMQEALAYRQTADAGYDPGVDDATALTSDMTQPIPQGGDDPWQGTNPYGCCRYNYDEHGVLHHGSPDCQHPEIVGYRG